MVKKYLQLTFISDLNNENKTMDDIIDEEKESTEENRRKKPEKNSKIELDNK